MDKCIYLVARCLHQNKRWFLLDDIWNNLTEEGFIFCRDRVCGCASQLYNQGLASRVRLPTTHGAIPFYKWHSHQLPEPEDYEDYFEPIPQDEITLAVQLSGEELERYLWCKEQRDKFYCGNGVIEEDD